MLTLFWPIIGLGEGMPFLTPDLPCGSPAFELSDDQIATVLDLICRGAKASHSDLMPGIPEVPTTKIVRKAMKRIKKDLGLTNLEIHGEYEVDNMATNEPSVLGRIDIILQFLHQFGEEDAYVAVECKRVRPGDKILNGRYVSQGVERFVTGKYAAGHQWGFMLGYMLALPTQVVIDYIKLRIRNRYGKAAALRTESNHSLSLAVLVGTLVQSGNHTIQLKHIFVDMFPAGP